MSRLADPLLAERRRRQILDAAMVCFRRRGFHQATMQEICSEAGISPGALYRYFGSKSEIIAAIASDAPRYTPMAISVLRLITPFKIARHAPAQARWVAARNLLWLRRR